MLRGHTAAFNVSRMNPGDSVAHNTYKASRYELCKSTREAKRQFSLKLEGNTGSRCMWQGLQTITD